MNNFDPSLMLTNIPLAIPKVKSFQEQMRSVNQPYTAKNLFNQLVQRIQLFESTLDADKEVGIQLVNFGINTTFSVSRLGYMDPSLIWFEGTLDNGSAVQLVQHVNQISFLTMALPRQNPDEPRSPIGFCLNQQNPSEP